MVEEGFDADYAQGQVVISHEFGDIRFKSSTGITTQELEERYDATFPRALRGCSSRPATPP